MAKYSPQNFQGKKILYNIQLKMILIVRMTKMMINEIIG